MRRLLNVVVSLVILFALVFGTIELVRLANGDFAGDYSLSGMFPRAGEGLHQGSAVVFRGVQVGRVSTINLDQNEAEVSVLIEPSFKVPTTWLLVDSDDTIPRGPTGKVDVRRLRELLAESGRC